MYPPHALFTFGGTLLGGQEIWTNNVRFGTSNVAFTNEVGAEPQILTELMARLFPRFSQSVSAGGLGYSSAVRLEWGKFNQIDASGKYNLATTTVRQDLPSPIVGGGSAVGNLPQAALVVTWLTAASRGQASKGRIYVPMPNVQVTTAGLVPPGETQSIADAWGALLTEWNDLPVEGVTLGADAELFPAVISGVGAGTSRRIERVRVGNRVDTMRSRRESLVEAFSVAQVGNP